MRTVLLIDDPRFGAIKIEDEHFDPKIHKDAPQNAKPIEKRMELRDLPPEPRMEPGLEDDPAPNTLRVLLKDDPYFGPIVINEEDFDDELHSKYEAPSEDDGEPMDPAVVEKLRAEWSAEKDPEKQKQIKAALDAAEAASRTAPREFLVLRDVKLGNRKVKAGGVVRLSYEKAQLVGSYVWPIAQLGELLSMSAEVTPGREEEHAARVAIAKAYVDTHPKQ